MSLHDTNQNADGDRLVSVREAATVYGVSVRTIWRMIADGQLVVVRIRRCTRIALSQLSPLLKGARK